MGKFKKFIAEEDELNEYPYLSTANGTIDLFGEKGINWIDTFIDKAKEFYNDKKFIASIKNPFFKLYWEKKAKAILDDKKLKKIIEKLPKNIKSILQ